MGHADESARKWEAAAQSCWGPGRLPAGEASVAILGWKRGIPSACSGLLGAQALVTSAWLTRATGTHRSRRAFNLCVKVFGCRRCWSSSCPKHDASSPPLSQKNHNHGRVIGAVSGRARAALELPASKRLRLPECHCNFGPLACWIWLSQARLLEWLISGRHFQADLQPPAC